MSAILRVAIADDERPARAFLASLLRGFPDVSLVGQAASGREAVALIEEQRPDLALLDLQMPELDGLAVVRTLKAHVPLVSFVTAFDEYAVQAFELNAIDYLLKPVDKARLRETLNRAQERLDRADASADSARLSAAADTYDALSQPAILERIPVRRRDEVLLIPAVQLASIVADGELLHLTTLGNERHTICYRLKDLESRLDPARFIRLARGTLANVEAITKLNLMPGGTYQAVLSNGQRLQVSRIQSRIIKDRLLKL